eukprot:360750-Chlamydomonas_euryale.AAC.10
MPSTPNAPEMHAHTRSGKVFQSGNRPISTIPGLLPFRALQHGPCAPAVSPEHPHAACSPSSPMHTCTCF